MSKGTNFKIVSVVNPETDEKVDVYVKYKWYYDPGVWTMANGDPGYPSDSEIEITDSHLSDSPDEPMPSWIDDEMLEDAIWDAGDVMSY